MLRRYFYQPTRSAQPSTSCPTYGDRPVVEYIGSSKKVTQRSKMLYDESPLAFDLSLLTAARSKVRVLPESRTSPNCNGLFLGPLPAFPENVPSNLSDGLPSFWGNDSEVIKTKCAVLQTFGVFHCTADGV